MRPALMGEAGKRRVMLLLLLRRRRQLRRRPQAQAKPRRYQGQTLHEGPHGVQITSVRRSAAAAMVVVATSVPT